MIAEPRDAATIMVLRDGDCGIEVYMLRRGSNSPTSPDAYVFPGGTVESADRSLQARTRLRGTWRPAEHAFTYAAIRETFEECGLLFTTTPVEREPLRAARTALLRHERTFGEVLRDLDRQLDADSVRYFSRWITPPSVSKRFDARFFVARAPVDQAPEADALETYDGRWIRPTDALAAAGRGTLQLIFPTYKHLERIATFADVDALLHFSATKTTSPITPEALDAQTFVLPPAMENAW